MTRMMSRVTIVKDGNKKSPKKRKSHDLWTCLIFCLKIEYYSSHKSSLLVSLWCYHVLEINDDRNDLQTCLSFLISFFLFLELVGFTDCRSCFSSLPSIEDTKINVTQQ